MQNAKAETIDDCEGAKISDSVASCDSSATFGMLAKQPNVLGLADMEEAHVGSVESWLLLPIPAFSLQDQLDDVSIESDSISIQSSCRHWMELPSCIDHYISADVKACCKHGVNVSYQRDGLGSSFIPLFQM